MKSILLIIALGFGFNSFAQVVVNGEDLNEKASTFEVYAFKKPFSIKESYFADYGQKFKIHNYDVKNQSIYDKDGKKFEKGEWIALLNYLNAQGWEQNGERSSKLGDNEGRIITFVKKKG